MISTDRDQFEAHLGILCAAFDKPPGDRVDAYWKAMQRMTIAEFARAVEFAIGENGPRKMPSTGALWDIRNNLRRGPAVPTQELLPMQPVPQWSVWRLRVDALMLRFIVRRRIGGYRGDINLAQRRAACRELWEFLEEHDREFGAQATRALNISDRFASLQARIEDASDSDAWLAIELNRQRLEGTRA